MEEKYKSMEEVLQFLSNHIQRPFLCINGDLDEDAVEEFRENVVPVLKEDEAEELTVLLNSPGGRIEEAYRIVLTLRRHVNNIEVIVPRMAKSAATFFCLAADTIRMGQYGELGPIDPQRRNMRGSAIWFSALESFNVPSQLLSFSLDSFDEVVQRLLHRAPMDVPYAIEHARPILSDIISPLFSQVDPREFVEAARSIDISEEYAVRVMKRWAYSDSPVERIHTIAERLTRHYPTHRFVIDSAEAKEIGLKVEELEDSTDELCLLIVDAAGPLISIKVPVEESESENEEADTSDINQEQSDHDDSQGEENSNQEDADEQAASSQEVFDSHNEMVAKRGTPSETTLHGNSHP